jgi:hypothetical protein
MRKISLFLLLFLGVVSILSSDIFPYKPSPILLIHGYNGNSKTWGAGAYMDGEIRTDSIHPDSIETGSTYDKLLDHMDPYAIVWDEIDPSYTHPGGTPGHPNPDPGYPNKTFLEIINFKHPLGSFDPDTGGGFPPWAEQEGWGSEIRRKIEKTLKEYYGPDWANDPNAKLILIAFSGGGLGVRQALTEAASHTPDLRNHVKLVITTSAPHLGTPFMDLAIGDFYTYSNLFWVPLMEFWGFPSFGSELFPGSIHAFVIITKDVFGGVAFTLLDGYLSWNLKKYTDAGRDMGTKLTSSFIRHINSGDALDKQSVPDYKVVVNELSITKSWRGADAAATAITLTGIQVVIYCAHLNFVMAALKSGSCGLFCNWLSQSDLAVYDWSQNPLRYTHKLRVKEVIRRYDKTHLDVGKDGTAILDAIEEPPVIHLDSVVTVDDEIYPISGTKDTVPGFIKGFWGRVDDYLLASNTLNCRKKINRD